jgi:hypothetical protein
VTARYTCSWPRLPPCEGTEVEYPLLRACSSSAALTAAGLHTHVRTHRTSSDPAYLYVTFICTLREEEEGCRYFRNPSLKRTFGLTVSLKTVTPHLRSIVPNVQRHVAYFARGTESARARARERERERERGGEDERERKVLLTIQK